MLTGRGWWAVEQRSEPGLVGTVGVFAREGFPDPFEIGWVTLRPFCGRGFATEAARGALGFAFDTWNADRVVAYIDDDNAPSLRVARAVGLVPDRKVDFYDTRLMRFVLDRPAFGG
jgi:RimJ/RimL family protein N-acetyltransferase